MNAVKESPFFRDEPLRINGERVRTARSLDAMNPYNGELVGRVSMASVDDVRRAFEVAKGYKAPAYSLRARCYPAAGRHAAA